ncbi:MAG: hypothetical protein HY290_08640 [Planctomycetia bacterium]|nr:hypothetical protein [Planctomycetia bacterium]
MTILLPTLAVAFAAFCVWLTVRIVNRRERWAKWTLVGLAAMLLVVYPLSFGPAVWYNGRYGELNGPPVQRFYSPIFRSTAFVPDSWRSAINWYANLGLGKGPNDFRADVGPDGIAWWN